MTLIGYWPLNEASGSTAYDHSGNENHGTINDGGDSTVPGANGPLGQEAYNFDGNNDYISVPEEQKWAKSDRNFSISLWLKSDDSTSDNMGVVSNYHSTGQDPFFMIGFDGSDFYFNIRDTSDNLSSASTSRNDVMDNQFHHVVGVRDEQTGQIKLYIDGIKADKASDITSDASYEDKIFFMDHFKRYTRGKLSEVRLYDRPLTQSEIQYLYSVGKRGLQTTSKKTS